MTIVSEIESCLIGVLIYVNYPIGVVISLEMATYAVDENDGNREVCAVLSSGTQIQVSIGLVTMNGSALSMLRNYVQNFQE